MFNEHQKRPRRTGSGSTIGPQSSQSQGIIRWMFHRLFWVYLIGNYRLMIFLTKTQAVTCRRTLLTLLHCTRHHFDSRWFQQRMFWSKFQKSKHLGVFWQQHSKSHTPHKSVSPVMVSETTLYTWPVCWFGRILWPFQAVHRLAVGWFFLCFHSPTFPRFSVYFVSTCASK